MMHGYFSRTCEGYAAQQQEQPIESGKADIER